jgi:UDP:flavonoid glycosyltransferase YjiC (YdhE family)
MYDSSTNAWTPLPTPIYELTYDACTVVWRESFMMFGKNNQYQIFNLANQTWSSFNSTPPISHNAFACTVLPNEEILLAGFGHSLLYNVVSNTWTILPNTASDYGAAMLVQLGSRIFVMGGFSNHVEEFNICSKTWTNVGVDLLVSHGGYGAALAVPADIFGGCQGI